MARDPGTKRRRKKPAYPKIGTGEDFPAHRPGTKTGESRSGGKTMQHTRAEQRRISKRPRRFSAQALPLARSRRGEPFRATTPRPARPGGTGEHTGYSRQYGRWI